MGIRGKTLLAITGLMLALLAVMGVGLYVTNARNASRIEEREVGDSLARAQAVVRSDEQSLQAIAADWGLWTDTLQYAQGKMPSYEANNLDDYGSVANLRVDFIAIIANDGHIIAGRQLGPNSTLVPLSAGLTSYLSSHPAILDMSNVHQSTAGLLSTPKGIYDIAAHPISDDHGTAPKAGTIVVGHALAASRLGQMKQLLLQPIDLRSADAPGQDTSTQQAVAKVATGGYTLSPNSDGTVTGYRLIPDIEGNSSILLSTVSPRVAQQLSAQSLTQSGAGMASLAVFMILAVGLALEFNVLRPLKQLGSSVQSVGESGQPDARVHANGSDEITTVARTINGMLDELEESHSDLAYLAAHDSLTRLFNRRRFEVELKRALGSASGEGSLLWIDLDHFKEVNDSLGHAAGDQLLIQFANLLASQLRRGGVVARLGGDEFGILLPNADAEEAVGAANRLLNLLHHRVFNIASREVRMSASIGITRYPHNGTTVDDLLARADLAMYEAKNKGRNAFSVYTSDGALQGEMAERVMMAELILRALREDRFQLYAQPIRTTADAQTRSYELLLRMVLEDGTIVMPSSIIPTAERIGLIRDIDRWVVKRGIQMIEQETARGHATSFAVNVSGTAFSDPELLDIIRDEIARAAIDPSRLIIEITETAAIADMERAKTFIQALKLVGCRFSLDDFGAGSSSFYYLKHLPVDFLKIDGGLVRSLGTDTTDEHFVRAIVEMCKGLGIPTVAEFVESDRLYDLVRDLGVDFAQGYGIGRPQPPGIYLASSPGYPDIQTPSLERAANLQSLLDPDVT